MYFSIYKCNNFNEAPTLYFLNLALAILNGERGYKRNAVLLNAGAALYIGGKSDSMKEGIALAAEIIDSGKALETLNKLIEVSNRSEV